MRFVSITACIVGFCILVYLYIQLLISRLDWDFGLGGINLGGTQFLNLGATVPVTVNASITNANPITLSFSNLYIQLNYNGQMLAQSTNQDIVKTIIAPGAITNIQEQLDIIVNANTIDFIANYTQNNPVNITYTVRMKLLGLVYFTYNGSKTLNTV